MFLARLLVPDDFGSAALAIVVGTIVSEIAKLGVSHAVVRLPKITNSHSCC